MQNHQSQVWYDLPDLMTKMSPLVMGNCVAILDWVWKSPTEAVSLWAITKWKWHPYAMHGNNINKICIKISYLWSSVPLEYMANIRIVWEMLTILCHLDFPQTRMVAMLLVPEILKCDVYLCIKQWFWREIGLGTCSILFQIIVRLLANSPTSYMNERCTYFYRKQW